MLSKIEFNRLLSSGYLLLDGATGSNLLKAGMPRGCCSESWLLDNPQSIIDLQRRYAEAGSHIIYAPTFQAQPAALEKVGLSEKTEEINARLVGLSKQAAPGCLIAGDIATMATVCESWNSEVFDFLVENYRRQIHGLIDGGADLIIGETLMYPQEAEAILTAAELEEAGAVMISFTMQSDGSLFSGRDVGPVLKDLEEAGASALGFNCVPADNLTPGLVSRLRRYTKLPLICKPNAGNPVINQKGEAEYDLDADGFSRILLDCRKNGAALLGGCCGTSPEFIAAVKAVLT